METEYCARLDECQRCLIAECADRVFDECAECTVQECDECRGSFELIDGHT